MDNRKKFKERRNHPRFKVKRGAVAAVIKTASEKQEQGKDVPMNEAPIASIQMGQIINISKGGLAFRYIDGETLFSELFDLDILFVQNSFYLKKMPGKTVWVSPALRKPPISLLTTNEQGVQFGDLTPLQISQLDFFLKNCTRM